jgi:predicted SAM-dependent methyltransferase
VTDAKPAAGNHDTNVRHSSLRSLKIQLIGRAKLLANRSLQSFGYEIRKVERSDAPEWPPGENLAGGLQKIHYACGFQMLPGWLNTDINLHLKRQPGFQCLELDLTGPHPFPDGWFEYGFAEDFIEHLAQSDSLIFLSEVYRTFKKGGVLRISFPGLEGVLRHHYRDGGYGEAMTGKADAYSKWDHAHFYSREEFALVCTHIGFAQVEFVHYGSSRHGPLQNLEYRVEQKDLNTYVEITK